MHIVDLLIVVFICAGAWSGYRKGAIGQILRIFGTFASYWIALRYHSLLVPAVQRLIPHTTMQQNGFPGALVEQGITFIVSFLLVTFVVSFVSMVIQGVFELPGLSFLNRSAGLLLGTCLSILVIAILIQLSQYVHIPSVNQAIGQSKFAQSFTHVFSGGLRSIQGIFGGGGNNPFHIA